MALFTPTAFWAGDTSPTPPFSPTSIPNLAGWYDASDTTSYIKSGTTITGISSQGNYGDNLGVLGGSNPAAGTQQNGLNTLYFNGSTAFENSSTDPLVSSGLHFAVGVFDPQQVNDTKDSLWSVDASMDYAISANQSSQWYGEVDLGNGVGSTGVLGPISTTNRENRWTIVTVAFSKIQSQGNYILFLINGSTQSSANWYTTYLNNLSTNQKLRIMANRNGNKKQPGRFGELLLFNGDCGVSNDVYLYRQQTEGYLAWKWGLQGNLPSDHPYKNNPPT
jgi:hypothetical protein